MLRQQIKMQRSTAAYREHTYNSLQSEDTNKLNLQLQMLRNKSM